MSPCWHALAQARESKQLNLREWFALRGAGYVGDRAVIVLSRYGITPSKAADRAENCVAMLTENGCSPTFPTPGYVVQRHPRFIRRLQDAGAELAVHGYHHVDPWDSVIGGGSQASSASRTSFCASWY